MRSRVGLDGCASRILTRLTSRGRVVAGSRMAIIGLGIMGRRMLTNALVHPRFEISGLWDPSALSVAKARELMPGAPIASDAAAAMAGADVVYLACPPGPRKAHALAATAAGQGVFMEKPLGTDEAESRDLVTRLKAGPLGAVVNFRRHRHGASRNCVGRSTPAKPAS